MMITSPHVCTYYMYFSSSTPNSGTRVITEGIAIEARRALLSSVLERSSWPYVMAIGIVDGKSAITYDRLSSARDFSRFSAPLQFNYVPFSTVTRSTLRFPIHRYNHIEYLAMRFSRIAKHRDSPSSWRIIAQTSVSRFKGSFSLLRYCLSAVEWQLNKLIGIRYMFFHR